MKCIGYIRVSSEKQAEKDGPERQCEVISRYAAQFGHELVREFADLGVSGASLDRPQLIAALDYCKANGVRLLLVESADRWARSVVVGENLLQDWIEAGIEVRAVVGDVNLSESQDEDKVMIRQMLGSISQNAKAKLVSRMKAARDRISSELGRRIEGRKPAKGHKSLSLLMELACSGRSWRAVSMSLNNRRVRTPTGKRWSQHSAYFLFRKYASPAQHERRERNRLGVGKDLEADLLGTGDAVAAAEDNIPIGVLPIVPEQAQVVSPDHEGHDLGV